jgi:hypothetical protein
MATVNTTEILGSDSISGSRITINSNFLLLQNWINGFVTVFGVDSVNGIMDLSAASTGKVMAKIGAFNSIQVPATGVAAASINSSGQASFSTIQATSVTASGAVTLSGAVVLSSGGSLTVGATASFNSTTNLNGGVYLGPLGHVVSQNKTYLTGLTSGSAFPANTVGGGGYYTSSMDSPYSVTGLEDVIYANCAGPTGFYLKVVDGVSPFGGTVSNIPAGSRLTIINTSAATGYIWTGVTGTSIYYTGFNSSSSYGGFSSSITVSQNKSYRSSIQLQWEPQVALNQASQTGSWVVLSATNMTV